MGSTGPSKDQLLSPAAAAAPGTHYDTPEGRRYAHPDLKRGLPSVTTVIGQAWPSGNLERWRIGNIAKAMCRDAEAVGKRFKRLSRKPEAMRELSADKVREWLLDLREDMSAADRGTRIHTATEIRIAHGKRSRWDRGLEPDERASAIGGVRAIKRFRLNPVHLELPLFGRSPVRYAGTADIIGTDEEGRWCVLDLKSGRRVSRTWLPQIAAYALADECWDGAQLQQMPPIERGLVLHVRPESATFYEVDLDYAADIWHACATVATAARGSKGITRISSA